MNLKLTEREQDALRKLASLGNVYHLLHDDASTLIACGLIIVTGDGVAQLTEDGRRYLRQCDIRLVRLSAGARKSAGD